MSTSLRSKLKYDPVPYERIVEFVRGWANKNGVTMESLAATPFDDAVERAVADNLITAVIEGSVNDGYITFTHGGHRLAKEMCKERIPKGRWNKVKGSASAVRRTAVLEILCGTFEEKIGLFAELMAACGFGNSPVSMVMTTVVMEALEAI